MIFLSAWMLGTGTSLFSPYPRGELRIWMGLLPSDDRADLIQLAPTTQRALLLDLLDTVPRQEVSALRAFKEGQAAGLIEFSLARFREMTLDEAISGKALCPEYVWSVLGCL
jgi:Mg/Co/Ni transporter MgtE